MIKPIVEINSLSKHFSDTVAIDSISAVINQGDVIALLGENGAGKSTLMEVVLGFSYPSLGQIKVFGDTKPVEMSDELKHKIGYVPQTDELLSNMTVKAYLDVIAGFYSDWDAVLIQRLINEWKLPPAKRISSLSNGQRQMVSILSAIGHHPEFLVLDEPVASLDPASRRRFLQLLIDSHITNNTTVLFSTHIVSDIERIASRVWLLKEGSLVLDESLDSVKERTKHSLEDLFLEQVSA